MTQKRTCMAPQREGSEEICGKTHAERFGDCPVHYSACYRHHKSEAAKKARSGDAKKGGRPSLVNKGGKAEPLEADDVQNPEQALTKVLDLPDEGRDILHALLEHKDIEVVARKLSLDPAEVERWVQEDKAFSEAYAMMKIYAPSHMREYLAVGAAMCAKRLVGAAYATKNVELLLKISRVIIAAHDKAVDKDIAEQLADLREQVDTLQDEMRKQAEAG